MKLTKTQKSAIKKATEGSDYCIIAHKRTMKTLVDKGMAEYTEGFGYRYGGIIQLTEVGKEILNKLLQQDDDLYRTAKKNGWLYSDKKAERLVNSKEYKLIKDFGKNEKLLAYIPYLPLFITHSMKQKHE